MNKEIISGKQGVCILTLFIFGSTLVYGTGGEAKKGAWLAIAIAVICALLMGIIYGKLLSMFPEKDLFDILKLVFGKFMGRALSLLFIWYTIHLGGLVLYNFGEFIANVGLGETPRVVPLSFMVILCVWAVREGIEVIGRWTEIMIIFVFFIIFMSNVLSIPMLKLDNLRPVLGNGIKPVINGAFSSFSYPFAETVLLTAVFSSLSDSKSHSKIYIKGLLLAGINIIIIAARNTMVVGEYVLSINNYPSFLAISRINIGNFIERLESAVSIVFLTCGFIKVSICLLAASKGVSKFFNFKDYRFIVMPIALIMMNFSFIVTKDMMELTKWNSQVYPYYAVIFQVILPGIILIGAKIRYKKICINGLNNA